MPDVRLPAQEPTLADAFAALPLEMPERSAWPALAARIAAAPPARTAAPRHWLLLAAAAAALAAIALLPRDGGLAPASPTPGPGPVAATPAAPASLDALMAESARLEHLVRQVSGDDAGSASATALALEYESRVQQIDVALSDPSLTADERGDLWARRVDLLREVAGVRGTSQWLAAQGGDYEGDLVAVF